LSPWSFWSACSVNANAVVVKIRRIVLMVFIVVEGFPRGMPFIKIRG
jgi:hypothetical protein